VLVGTFDLAEAIDLDLPRHAHSHDFFTLAYLEHGESTVRVDGRTVNLTGGDVLLIAPGAVIDLGAALERAQSLRGIGVAFSGEALGGTAHGARAAWRTDRLLSVFASRTDEPAVVSIAEGERAAWEARLDAIARELEEGDYGSTEAIAAHLTLLLVDLARHSPAEARITDGGTTLLDEALGYIDAHYREPISLQDTARAVHVSAGHLTTVIGRLTGRTVHEWITHRRLAEARRLLAHTDLGIDEIGRRVGYRDPSYFARAFRRQHDRSPRSWRAAAREAST